MEEKADINSRIVDLLDKFTTSLGVAELRFDLDYNWSDIFKLYNLGFEEDYSHVVDKLVSYIKIISQFTDIRLLFLVNFRSYASAEDLERIFEISGYCKINIFLLEPYEYGDKEMIKRYVIDNDLCFIDMN